MAGSSTCLNSVVEVPVAELLITHYPTSCPGSTRPRRASTRPGQRWRGWRISCTGAGGAGRQAETTWPWTQRRPAWRRGADGILALPVLGDGERTDADLRAAFTGLSARHGRGVLARAMLEGVAFAIRGQLDLLRRAGAPVSELRVSGGDTRLATWNRIKADVTGLAVRPISGDAATTGVAMLAGMGSGVYGNVDEAIARCVRLDPAIEPSAATRVLYDDAYGAYVELAGSAVVRRSNASNSLPASSPSVGTMP